MNAPAPKPNRRVGRTIDVSNPPRYTPEESKLLAGIATLRDDLRRERDSIGPWTGLVWLVYATPWAYLGVTTVQHFDKDPSLWPASWRVALVLLFAGYHWLSMQYPERGLWRALRAWKRATDDELLRLQEESDQILNAALDRRPTTPSLH